MLMMYSQLTPRNGTMLLLKSTWRTEELLHSKLSLMLDLIPCMLKLKLLHHLVILMLLSFQEKSLPIKSLKDNLLLKISKLPKLIDLTIMLSKKLMLNRLKSRNLEIDKLLEVSLTCKFQMAHPLEPQMKLSKLVKFKLLTLHQLKNNIKLSITLWLRTTTMLTSKAPTPKNGKLKHQDPTWWMEVSTHIHLSRFQLKLHFHYHMFKTMRLTNHTSHLLLFLDK